MGILVFRRRTAGYIIYTMSSMPLTHTKAISMMLIVHLACKDNTGAVDAACTIGAAGVRDTEILCEADDATNGSHQ